MDRKERVWKKKEGRQAVSRVACGMGVKQVLLRHMQMLVQARRSKWPRVDCHRSFFGMVASQLCISRDVVCFCHDSLCTWRRIRDAPKSGTVRSLQSIVGGDQMESKMIGWCFQEHNTLFLGGRRDILGSKRLQNLRLEATMPREDEEVGHPLVFPGRMGSR